GRQLRAAVWAAIDQRHEWLCATRIGSVVKAEFSFQLGHCSVDLPAGGAVHPGGSAEYAAVGEGSLCKLAARPSRIATGDKILPAHVVKGVNAGLETRIGDGTHDITRTARDVRAR